ncbi:trihelix transcription factor ASIL2-like [Canna indica]|uniref:Trihelix transcription factor ASIL2-like n=1 Tax=Canna indica TaxID=4628 RepID=A0AAQ3KZF1_9LILI|nr:trihelix transcription factor ASIL2-like [Canna indica]
MSWVGASKESQWPFFYRLQSLIGSSPPTVGGKKPPASPPFALPLPFHRKSSPLLVATAVHLAERQEKRSTTNAFLIDNPFLRRAAAAAAAAIEDNDDEDEVGSGYPSRSSSRS